MQDHLRLAWNARPLRTLEAIARLGSVSAAAGELGYTQSAASQQLALLERAAGVTLVVRGVRPLRLTEAGERVLPHAQAVLAGFVGIEGALAQIHGLAVGRVRLVAFVSALATIVPPAVADLARRRPELAVEIAAAEPGPAVAALRAGAADVAVLYRIGASNDDDGLHRRAVLSDPLCVVTAERHALSEHDTVALGALATVPLVAPRRDGPARPQRLLIERLFAAAGAEPRIAYEVDDLPAAQALVRAGLAVVLMHGLTIPAAHPGLDARPLDDAGQGTRVVEVATLEARSWPPADALADLIVAADMPPGSRSHSVDP
jgi:DNA-binding transcriptional LysR family regulator